MMVRAGDEECVVKLVFEEVARRAERGERVALCVVVGARGSTPQGVGAKMMVTAAGETVGTLGGGCVEAEVRRRALGLLARGEAGGGGEFVAVRLDSDLGWDDGLICGGTLEIFVRVVGAAEAAEFSLLAAAMGERRGAVFAFAYVAGEAGLRRHEEVLEPGPVLVIAGAGHVGQALGALAGGLGFELVVVDDRGEFAHAGRFPGAKRIVVGEVEAELGKMALDGQTYVVIVTRGHRGDGRALLAAVRQWEGGDGQAGPRGPKYVGLIGSKRKVLAIVGDLAAAGVGEELLRRVHAPIGLAIGAETVGEIAVSIAAELVAVRHGAEGGGAMRVSAEQVRAAVRRGSSEL